VGRAMRGLLGGRCRIPTWRRRSHEIARGNTATMMREIAANAVAGGECDPAVATELRLEAGPALLRQRFIFTTGPIGDDFLVGVVDQVLLPLLGARP
jgi:tetracycline repressor-like protein